MKLREHLYLTAALAFALPAHAETREQSLVRAIRSGDEAVVESLLDRRANPNGRLPDGSTPLSWAVESQNPAMVRLLLAHGAKPDAVDPAASTPALIVACQHGDTAIIDMLITARADIQQTSSEGIAPLSLCAGNAARTVVARLIASDADVEAADHKGQTPLMWAAASGRVDNIELLLKHRAQVNRRTQRGFTPLFFALKSGEPKAAMALLDAGADADYVAPEGTSVVQLAMYQGAYDFAAKMIERGANLTAFDRNGNQLLHAAVLTRQPALVKLLLAKGANVNALTGPSRVKKRYEVNFTSAPYAELPKPPLMLAAELGAADIMRALVAGGADDKYRTDDGTNIVLAAAASGKLAALEYALQLAPNANVVTASGETPLHVILGSTATSDTAAMMKLLADKGAGIDIKNRAGRSPADLAKEAQTEMKLAWDATFAHHTLSNL